MSDLEQKIKATNLFGEEIKQHEVPPPIKLNPLEQYYEDHKDPRISKGFLQQKDLNRLHEIESNIRMLKFESELIRLGFAMEDFNAVIEKYNCELYHESYHGVPVLAVIPKKKKYPNLKPVNIVNEKIFVIESPFTTWQIEFLFHFLKRDK